MSELVVQLFSFGYGQAHPNMYIKIKAPSKAAARAAMFHLYGSAWSMQYDEDQEEALIKADMHLLDTMTVGDEHLGKPEEEARDGAD